MRCRQTNEILKTVFLSGQCVFHYPLLVFSLLIFLACNPFAGTNCKFKDNIWPSVTPVCNFRSTSKGNRDYDVDDNDDNGDRDKDDLLIRP